NGRPNAALSAFRMETSDIKHSISNNETITYQYNLQGQKVDETTKGLVIVKQGNRTNKVVRR
ncbi:MAG: hypothetical protein II449_05435, partial [Prevotella sp.]|nr:hypothetical protein [Prevotella sp.]